MSAELLVARDDVQVFHATWAELLAILPYRDDGTKVDALIVDAPYSERTHSGHDDGAVDANRGADMARRIIARGGKPRGHRADKAQVRERSVAAYGVNPRRTIDYSAWSDDDVRAFVEAWAPVTRGWMVSITDHVLAPAWADAMGAAGRYTFAPLPFYAPGSRVRLSGDGPSAWTCWIGVSRPRSREFFQWGTLPGGYALPPGYAERMPVVGGKPLWLMERLVEDYSRPGDLVCDPCCGAGTTLLAALRTGRVAVGGDAMREHAEIAADRCGRRMVQRPLFGGAA